MNKINFQLEENTASTSYASQEKMFLENLPKDFFQLNESVLSASRNNLWEINKLNSSIEQASNLLNSINISCRGTSTLRKDLERVVPSCEDTTTSKRNVSLEHSSAFKSLHNSITNPLLSISSTSDSAKTDPCNVSDSKSTNLLCLQDLSSSKNCRQTESPIAVQRHRRVWNLKEAKHLWENEELFIPERPCHSEPSSKRCSPLLTQTMSYSLNCLDKAPDLSDEFLRHPNPLNPKIVPVSSARDNLQKPVSCLERSIDTLTASTEEDPNLYAYYMNLYKNMSGFISQQGESISPCLVNEDQHIQGNTSKDLQLSTTNVQRDPESTLRESIRDSEPPVGKTPYFQLGVKRARHDTNEESCGDDNSYSDRREDSELSEGSNSNLFSLMFPSTTNLNPVNRTNTHQIPADDIADLLHFPCDEDFDLEIPDNLDDIEQFLKDLQRTQEAEMTQLMKKQQEEQAWLKQRQQRLKESVLSVSSRSSSQQSSLNCSQMNMQDDESSIHTVRDEQSADITKSNEWVGHLEAARNQNIAIENTDNFAFLHNTHDFPTPQSLNTNLANSKERTSLRNNSSSQNNMVLDNGKPFHTRILQNQTLPCESEGITNKSMGSNKSTPSQHYDSCEEWFTPEADKMSPTSQDQFGESVDKDGHKDLLLSDGQSTLAETTEKTLATTHFIKSEGSVVTQGKDGLLELECERDVTKFSLPSHSTHAFADTKTFTDKTMINKPRSSNTSQWVNELNLDTALDEKSKASIQQYIRQWAELSCKEDTKVNLSTNFSEDEKRNTFGAENQYHTRPVHVTNRSVGVLRDIINTPQHFEMNSKPLIEKSEWKNLVSKEPVKAPEKNNENLLETPCGPYEHKEKLSHNVNALRTKPLDDAQSALLWQQWMEEIHASKMAHHSNNLENPSVVPFSELSANPTFSELFGSDESLKASDGSVNSSSDSSNNINANFSPETQAKIFDILGKEWPREFMFKGSKAENYSETNQRQPLSSVSKPQPSNELSSKSILPHLPFPMSSTAVLPMTQSVPSTSQIPTSTDLDFRKKEEISYQNFLRHGTQSSINEFQSSPGMFQLNSGGELHHPENSYVESLQSPGISPNKPCKDNAAKVSSNPSPDSVNSCSDISETSRRSSSDNLSRQSSAPVSLDSIKQRYLLTPNVKRTPGLHEFETNVMTRLHREASNRPKAIIKSVYSQQEKVTRKQTLQLIKGGWGEALVCKLVFDSYIYEELLVCKFWSLAKELRFS